MYPELSESERFPLLTVRGRTLLNKMRQHQSAPIWNWPNGEQLDAGGLEKVHRFAESLQLQTPIQDLGEPDWLADFTERCLNDVPFYREHSGPETPFDELPAFCRADLAPRVWDFVPDDQPVDELVVFSSSGTTGYPTRTPHHPFSAACGIPIIEHALRSLHGIELLRGPDQVAITNVAAYPGAYTTAIVVAFLEEAGCVRVNLDPSAWRDTADCERFINAWRAPIWLGDPVAFSAMEKIPVDHAPTAIVSSIMHLSVEHADSLRSRYECPILDLYAMTEAGIISVRESRGHRILPHDLFVEILDESGHRAPPGVRGEITLSGGRNPFLPLLRYRTGDFGTLALIDGHRYLLDFTGRIPIEYPTASGRVVHSMELVRLMRGYPVRRYEMNSAPEGGYVLELEGTVDQNALRSDLEMLFGSATNVRINCT